MRGGYMVGCPNAEPITCVGGLKEVRIIISVQIEQVPKLVEMLQGRVET